MIALDDDFAAARVRRTAGEIVLLGESLGALGGILQGFAAVGSDTPSGELVIASVGVRAAAVQAVLLGASATSLAERLGVLAEIAAEGELSEG